MLLQTQEKSVSGHAKPFLRGISAISPLFHGVWPSNEALYSAVTWRDCQGLHQVISRIGLGA